MKDSNTLIGSFWIIGMLAVTVGVYFYAGVGQALITFGVCCAATAIVMALGLEE